MKSLIAFLVCFIFTNKFTIAQQSVTNKNLVLSANKIASGLNTNFLMINDSIPLKKKTLEKSTTNYLIKGKKFTTAGSILLGIGLSTAAIGFFGSLQTNNFDFLSTTNGEGYFLVLIMGIATTVSGVAVLSTGAHYKKKAALIFNNENISQAFHVPVKANIFSVGVSFSLR